MPLSGLLVSIREAKNSGFSSQWTTYLHPDWQAFTGETTWNGDRRQRQHIKRARVVQHLEFLWPSSIWVGQIGDCEWRNQRSRSDHEVDRIEHA